MSDGSTKEYYYVYYTYGNGQYSKGIGVYRYKPSYEDYDAYKHAGPTTIVNELKSIFED